MTTPTSGDSFPRQYARTRRLSLGEPRDLRVSPDGRRVVFTRSASGSDPVHRLWVLDPTTGEERLVADPMVLLAGDDEDLPAEERARRERAREMASGVVTYATDPQVRVAAFALSGRLFVAGLISAQARELVVEGPVFDPRPDPTAQRVAYVSGRVLKLAELDGQVRTVASSDEPDVTWGSADFIAAEEMGRSRGYWWSPSGTHLAVARVDTSPIQQWYLADPADPSVAPRAVRYPAAGTANSVTSLFVVALDGTAQEVEWDHAAFPYLADVTWGRAGLHLVVQSRDQRTLKILQADLDTIGDSIATTTVYEDFDDQWVELVRGVPGWLGDGRLVVTADRDGARRLMVGHVAVTPTVLQVRSVAAITDDEVLFTANDVDDATEVNVWRWSTSRGISPVTADAGVHGVVASGATTVVTSATAKEGPRTYVMGGATIASHAEAPLVELNISFAKVGASRLATALLLPRDHQPGTKLPVLLDPYGGPHAARVVQSRNGHLTSQWFADQGFAVVVIDGRGTPGRGSAWERAVHHDFATPVLDDQVDGLHALADANPDLDLSRVGIRGWSFGGYLAALAVLRRPDVFHCAIAGAPVTEWRLYDTHYTERYLGHPDTDADAYDRSSLLPLAASLTRPLLLIHGFADDNVVAAHTLQLSQRLMETGRPHVVLPLAGVSHMTPQEEVAENLLLIQLAFLRKELASASQ
ncbi:MAG: prolyl oligopeptidase family serine peptidase [Acidimicrobiia bacterium]